MDYFPHDLNPASVIVKKVYVSTTVGYGEGDSEKCVRLTRCEDG